MEPQVAPQEPVPQQQQQQQQHKRKRSRNACEPCRERKRKCDGELPCDTCKDFEYDCYYDSSTRKRKSLRFSNNAVGSQGPSPTHISPPSVIEQPTPNGPPSSQIFQSQIISLESNSTANFVRNLGLKLDPENAPRLHSFAWNLGIKTDYGPAGDDSTPLITHVINQAQMETLALAYFSNLQPVYDIVDAGMVYRGIAARWAAPEASPTSFDPVLCGIAALGSLFSKNRNLANESKFVGSALRALNTATLVNHPSIDHVLGWLLRVLYLRTTASPQPAWIASCTTMHMVEATGLHLEPDDKRLAASPLYDADARRRIYWVAVLHNTWISFEAGRSRVEPFGASCQAPEVKGDNPTSMLIDIFRISDRLAPAREGDAVELERAFWKVHERTFVHPAAMFGQGFLLFGIYRRFRVLVPNIPTEIEEVIIEKSTTCLKLVLDLLPEDCPWWHIASTPFHVVCVLLAIDSRASLHKVGMAMDVLGRVTAKYDNSVMRDAYATARLLVRLHQRRKEDDARVLASILEVHCKSGTDTPKSMDPKQSEGDLMNFNWLNDPSLDLSEFANFDLDQFLSADASWSMIS